MTWLLALAAGCGSNAAPDPSVLPLARWGAEYAAATCAKMFGCCDSGEQTTLRFASEAACRQMRAEDEQSALSQDVNQGVIVYDPKAARRCVDEIAAASCSAFFHDPASQTAPSCQDVVRGALPLGAACEDLDAICASGYCTGTCAPRPGCPAGCNAGQFCDQTNTCSPTQADGSSCLDSNGCTPPSVCRLGVCGALLADGTANCRQDADCASGRCALTSATTTGCAARLPDDATCTRDPDCVSGVCLGIDPGPRTCGSPTPDGSPCATNSQCTSGECVVRAAGAMATCGPPYCDGV